MFEIFLYSSVKFGYKNTIIVCIIRLLQVTSLMEVLRQRSQTSPDHLLFTLMNSRGAETESITCAQLLKRAERIGSMLTDKGRLNPGEHVALIFPPGIDLIAAFYGCQAAGALILIICFEIT